MASLNSEGLSGSAGLSVPPSSRSTCFALLISVQAFFCWFMVSAIDKLSS